MAIQLRATVVGVGDRFEIITGLTNQQEQDLVQGGLAFDLGVDQGLYPALLRRQGDGSVSLLGPDARNIKQLNLADTAYLPARNAFLDPQPIGITRGCTGPGKLLCRFLASEWSVFGSSVLADHTGYDASGNITGVVPRTGMPSMLKIIPADDTNEGITQSGASLTAIFKGPKRLINGWFGLWVYVESQPGYEAGGGATTGSLTVELSTTTSFSNNLAFGFNPNQLREGWNFLVFRMRNPSAYMAGSGVTERHPYGLGASGYGTGAATDVVNNDILAMRVMISGTGITGRNYYLDSAWTDLSFMPQFVIGFDTSAASIINYGIPKMAEHGWRGYATVNASYWNGTDPRIFYNFVANTNLRTIYDAGWEIVNHGLMHLPGSAGTPTMKSLTNPGEIAYEVLALRTLQQGLGLNRGAEFYISPNSQSSRLSEKVIAEAGFKLQRHGTPKHNNYCTPWGIENPRNLGSLEFGYTSAIYTETTSGTNSSINGNSTIDRLRNWVDMMIDYGATAFPFSHDIQTSGDSGSGTDVPAANNVMRSTWYMFADYIADKEAAGLCRVRDGFTGLYYGVGR